MSAPDYPNPNQAEQATSSQMPPSPPTPEQPSTVQLAAEASSTLVELRLRLTKKTLWLIVGFIMSAILVIIAAFYLLNLNSQTNSTDQQDPDTNQPTATLSGEIALAEGNVQYQSDSSWVAVTSGQSVKQGTAIKTGPDARAVINLDDGSAVRLDQSSEITLTALNNSTITITQISGRAYHRVEPGQVTYQVNTPQATTTALGTIFSTSSNQSTDTVHVLESKVRVKPKAMLKDLDNNQVEVATGKQAFINPTELKVDSIDQDSLKDDFYLWNSALDKGQPMPSATPKPTSTPQPTKTIAPASSQAAAITLTGSVGPGKATLKWKLHGTSAPQGFKIIKSHTDNPAFGKDEAVYVSDSQATSYTWANLDNKATNFRIGIYNGSGISLYSNTINITPQAKPSSVSYSGNISLGAPVREATKVILNWTATNQDQVGGWKVVYSTSPNPTYPEHTANYASPSDRSTTFKDLPSGTYYFRVGAWIDSKVTNSAYSNQVQITIP